MRTFLQFSNHKFKETIALEIKDTDFDHICMIFSAKLYDGASERNVNILDKEMKNLKIKNKKQFRSIISFFLVYMCFNNFMNDRFGYG